MDQARITLIKHQMLESIKPTLLELSSNKWAVFKPDQVVSISPDDFPALIISSEDTPESRDDGFTVSWFTVVQLDVYLKGSKAEERDLLKEKLSLKALADRTIGNLANNITLESCRVGRHKEFQDVSVVMFDFMVEYSFQLGEYRDVF